MLACCREDPQKMFFFSRPLEPWKGHSVGPERKRDIISKSGTQFEALSSPKNLQNRSVLLRFFLLYNFEIHRCTIPCFIFFPTVFPGVPRVAMSVQRRPFLSLRFLVPDGTKLVERS